LTYRGAYLTWLPPSGDPGAPRRVWLRARMQDHAHLCPKGLRYADAVLSDFRQLFALHAANASWFTADWTNTPEYQTRRGLPSDHPPLELAAHAMWSVRTRTLMRTSSLVRAG